MPNLTWKELSKVLHDVKNMRAAVCGILKLANDELLEIENSIQKLIEKHGDEE